MKYPIAIILTLIFSAAPSYADTLELYPKSRAAYQDKFAAATERYETDQRGYIDDLYENKAEGGKPASSRERMLPEGEVNAILDAQGEASQQSATPPQPTPSQ